MKYFHDALHCSCSSKHINTIVHNSVTINKKKRTVAASMLCISIVLINKTGKRKLFSALRINTC